LENIVLVTIKDWNISNYFKLKKKFLNIYNFHIITEHKELTSKKLSKLSPKYIFFPHWSWIIPKKIYENFECIVFHMTDLPFGRGGSPMQNLIIREIYDTKISAIRVGKVLDAGEIYMKEDFNISKGSAEENFIKLSNIIFEKMIPKFLTLNLIPKNQIGNIVNFKRRTPKESNIYSLEKKSLKKLYDFIRMLDAEGYPKAYALVDNLKIEFSDVNIKNNKLTGKFEVITNE